MKKLLSIVLALSLCLTAMMGCFVVSAETAAIVVAGNTVAPGQDATVTVTGTNFDAVCAADLVITLPAGFELVSITNDGEPLYKDGSAEAEENGPDYYYNETANTVKYVDVFNFQSETKPLALVLVVKTPADAEDKAYDVTAAVVAGDYEENFVYPAITNGAITLKTPCAHAEFTYTNNGDNHTKACAANCGEFEAVVEDHVYGEDNKCVCGAEKVVEPEEPTPEYSNLGFAVSQAVKVIEPWAIKFTIYHADLDNNAKTLALSKFSDYGLYILSEIHVPEGTTVDMDYVIANGKKLDTTVATAQGNGTTYDIIFTDEIYTYLMNKTIYFVPYAVSNGATVYNRVRETSLVSVLNERRGDIADGSDEANVIDTMLSLYSSVVTYRGNDNYSEVVKTDIPRVSDVEFAEIGTDTSFQFATSMAVKVIEPWALAYTITIYNGTATAVQNITSFDDYGLIMLKASDVASAPDVASMLANGKGYVYSKSNGNITTSGNSFTAIFDDEIYTYQMAEDYYYLPFCVKNGKMYVRPAGAASTSIKATLETRLSQISANTEEKIVAEKAVINDMLALYDYVEIYRS